MLIAITVDNNDRTNSATMQHQESQAVAELPGDQAPSQTHFQPRDGAVATHQHNCAPGILHCL